MIKSLLFFYPTSVPLLIEVYHRDAQAKDVLLGVARVTLGQVFSAEKLHAAVSIT